jgi:hypothetical protein
MSRKRTRSSIKAEEDALVTEGTGDAPDKPDPPKKGAAATQYSRAL